MVESDKWEERENLENAKEVIEEYEILTEYGRCKTVRERRNIQERRTAWEIHSKGIIWVDRQRV